MEEKNTNNGALQEVIKAITGGYSIKTVLSKKEKGSYKPPVFIKSYRHKRKVYKDIARAIGSYNKLSDKLANASKVRLSSNDLVYLLALVNDMPVSIVKDIVDDFFTLTKIALVHNVPVVVRQFGRFYIKPYSIKRHTTPIGTIKGGTYNVIKFKQSAALKRELNKGK